MSVPGSSTRATQTIPTIPSRCPESSCASAQRGPRLLGGRVDGLVAGRAVTRTEHHQQSGRFRGIYAENNPAVVPIFKEWLAPFASMGGNTVAMAKTGATDHVYMQYVGLPGFQFIQDPLDYSTRTHHSNADTFDHLKAEDLRQNAVMLASLLLNAANRAESLPRPPFPTKPTPTDPFGYHDDSKE